MFSCTALFDIFMKTDTPRTHAKAAAIQRSGIDWHFSAKKMADFAAGLECESARRKDALLECLQYLPSRAEAPGFRARIDEALGILSNGQEHL